MKKIITLIVIGFITITVSAQFDINYSFWNTAIHPDNSNAEAIMKTGYTNMLAVEYDATADDTAETIKEIKFLKYDKTGRIIFAAPNKTGKGVPFGKYEYGTNGKVKKYTYQEKYYGSQTQYPEEVYEFVYAENKLLTIKYKGHRNYKWSEAERKLQFTSPKDTVVYNFDSTGNLTKFYNKYLTDKNGIETKTTHYTYNKNGKILTYDYVKRNQKQDSVEYITTKYNYSYDSLLAFIHTERYSYDDGAKYLNREEDFNFTNDEKGRFLGLESAASNFYIQEGEEMIDFYAGSVGYTYTTEGLLSKKEVYSDPGFETIEVYNYSK